LQRDLLIVISDRPKHSRSWSRRSCQTDLSLSCGRSTMARRRNSIDRSIRQGGELAVVERRVPLCGGASLAAGAVPCSRASVRRRAAHAARTIRSPAALRLSQRGAFPPARALASREVVGQSVSVRRRRLRPISEAVAYSRCHGDRGHDLVRIVKLEPRPPRYAVLALGERLRIGLEPR